MSNRNKTKATNVDEKAFYSSEEAMLCQLYVADISYQQALIGHVNLQYFLLLLQCLSFSLLSLTKTFKGKLFFLRKKRTVLKASVSVPVN